MATIADRPEFTEVTRAEARFGYDHRMLLLLLSGIVFLFLLIGSTIFLACLPLLQSRQYALSAALWCAMWGPCTVVLMLIAGVGLIATAFVENTGSMQTFHAPRLVAAFGRGYLLVGILVTALVATVTAWAHQALMRRLTFALFRVYAAVVVGGIGSVFGWSIGWWMMAKSLGGHVPILVWSLCMLTLIASFGAAAYRGARGLRGVPPENFTWISHAEYMGN